MTKPTRHLTQVRMELARSKGYPDGSKAHGYELVAPLDASGHLDAAAWKTVRDRCRVRRFWAGESDDLGHLVHRPGGTWAFHYDIDGDEDDEAGFKLAQHTFNIGDYVSVRSDDGDLHTFRVVGTEPVPL